MKASCIKLCAPAVLTVSGPVVVATPVRVDVTVVKIPFEVDVKVVVKVPEVVNVPVEVVPKNVVLLVVRNELVGPPNYEVSGKFRIRK